jgi:RNase H-like domain found in reverse transcriptase
VLGLFRWFPEFIPNYAQMAYPLTALTSKRVLLPVPWSEVEQRSYDQLKEPLCEKAKQSLEIIDWNKPILIRTDASENAVAGILLQPSEAGDEHPIAYYSKKLNATQRAWATIEKEAYAILEALHRFRYWVFGAKIVVLSDHNPLAYLIESAPDSAKLMRWALALQNYEITFHYKVGKSSVMAAPDCLSRMGPDDCGADRPPNRQTDS